MLCERGHEVIALDITVHNDKWDDFQHLNRIGCWKCGQEGLSRKTTWRRKYNSSEDSQKS